MAAPGGVPRAAAARPWLRRDPRVRFFSDGGIKTGTRYLRILQNEPNEEKLNAFKKLNSD
jgi:hypothetical protein